MSLTERSACPINLAIELFGDRWTLLILRDIVFADRRHFRHLLRESEEHVTNSILADRLEKLTSAGILTREDDATHKQKAVYCLTEKGVELVPVLATIGVWGTRYCPADPEKASAARSLSYELPGSWSKFMESLRVAHRVSAARG